MNKIGTLTIWLIVVFFSFTQCRKEATTPVIEKPVIIPAASEVNYFVWSSMHDYYLWNSNVSNIINTNFITSKDSLNLFLNKYSDPNKLFEDLLYQHGVVDKWSFIVDDYSIIEDWVAGISKSMGYDFQLYLLSSGSTEVFGVIRYVLPGSPAEKAGLKRGDFFTKIDGTQLTTSNYSTLIAQESFALTLAQLSNGTLTTTTTTPVMTALKIQEDPIYLNKVLDVNGAKVGYIVYNGFTTGDDPENNDYTPKFDIELNSVLQNFKTAGISKLIVDLRYNGGGSVQTATYFASMIYSNDVTKIFSKSVYNTILQNYFTQQYGADALLNKFTDNIAATASSPKIAINSLNLSDVYFLVSKETASASELLINGLKPYMNVTVIGTSTYGKYVGSFTIKDYDSKGNLVTTHKWAMQPITVKIANSAGVTDYVDGLTSDISVKEDVGNLLPLGDENELLLKTCLDRIKGLKSAAVYPTTRLANSRYITGTRDLRNFSHDMYIDQPKTIRKEN
jgi:carboxyl-terminal processing protease